MELLQWSPAQALTALQCMHAVASLNGESRPLAIEQRSIDCIMRYLLRSEPETTPVAPSVPENLERRLDSPAHRRELVRYLALLPLVSPRVEAGKVAMVEAIARRLGVSDDCLGLLRHAARGRFRRFTLTIMRHGVSDYLRRDGQTWLQSWCAMAQLALQGLKPRDRKLAARYQTLAGLPEGSMGRELFDYYRKYGFAMPGEPKSFPETFVLHEFYHILSGYPPSTLKGEMLVAAFTGGNLSKHPIDYIMMSLVQFQLGKNVGGVNNPARPGLLEPEKFFRAIERGATMTLNLMEWDWWKEIAVPIEEFRALHDVPLEKAVAEHA